MPYSKDQVYQESNFKFATKAPGRAPTLYFRTNHGSGRLRQEHSSGAKTQDIRKHTSHAFFRNLSDRDNFAKAFKKGDTRKRFRELRVLHNGGNVPTEGYYHFEATFDAHSEDGKATTLHKSQGQVVSEKEFNILKPKVKGIYERMKGAEAEVT